MEITYGNASYSTGLVQNNEEGWIGLELNQLRPHEAGRIARVTFWDAVGQFSFEMSCPELPLVVVEALIAEAKRLIRVG